MKPTADSLINSRALFDRGLRIGYDPFTGGYIPEAIANLRELPPPPKAGTGITTGEPNKTRPFSVFLAVIAIGARSSMAGR